MGRSGIRLSSILPVEMHFLTAGSLLPHAFSCLSSLVAVRMPMSCIGRS